MTCRVEYEAIRDPDNRRVDGFQARCACGWYAELAHLADAYTAGWTHARRNVAVRVLVP